MADGPETEHTMSDTTTSTTDAPQGGSDTSTTTGTDQQQTQQPSGNQSQGQQNGSNQQQAGDGDKKFSQAELDKKIEERLAREKKKQDGTAQQVEQAKQEAADAKSAHEKLMAGLADALGLKKDDAPPDPAALQQTLAQRENRVSELEQQVQARDVELAAWKSAVENGANPVLLMDRRSVVSKLDAIDRKAEDRDKQIDAVVKAAIEADESLKAAGTPRTPRPDPSQGSGRPGPTGAEKGNAEAARRFGSKTTN